MYKDKIRKLRTNPSFSGQVGQVKCKKQKKNPTQHEEHIIREAEEYVGGCVMRLSKHPF